MSKKKNTFLGELIFTLLLIIGSLFTYLFSLNEIKGLSKEKDALENQLVQKIDKKEILYVELERYSTEDRIVKIAQDSLALTKSLSEYDKLYLDGSQVSRIERIISDKYE